MVDTRKRTMNIQVNDRISELPNNAIDVILNHLPIDDAVRTSILSRKWRHHWTRVENLVLDEKFAEIVRKNSKESIARTDYELWGSAYIDAVYSLLLLHNGPINKFIIRLPRLYFGDTIGGIVCKWVRALSLHGVKEFTLDAGYSGIEHAPVLPLPSYIFNCLEMRRLALHQCIVCPPFNFRGFKNLISLQLDYFSISENALNTLISHCPLLEELFLKGVRVRSGSYSVCVCALNLRILKVEGRFITALSLQNVPNLATLSIRDLQPEQVDEHTFTSFFGAMPKVTNLTIGGEILTGWATHGFPKMLPTPLDSLSNLSIVNFNQAEPKQMNGTLCILQSSPNLRRLNLEILRPSGNAMDEAAAVGFLHEWLTEPKYFPSSLSTVTIKGLTGSQAQILLLKLILTSCPSLEMLNLSAVSSIRQRTELQMMAELLECRALSKSKITYIKGEGKYAEGYTMGNIDTSIFEF